MAPRPSAAMIQTYGYSRAAQIMAERQVKQAKAQRARRERKAADRQATLWGVEQSLTPWEIALAEKVPKKKTNIFEDLKKRVTEATTIKPPPTQRDRLASEARQRLREQAALSNDPRARLLIAGTLAPERKKQLTTGRITPTKKPGPSFWSLDPRESAASVLGFVGREAKEEARQYQQVWGDIFDDLWKTTFDEDEREELRKLQQSAMDISLEGGKIVSDFLGPKVGKRVEGDLQTMGVSAENAKQANKIVRDFIEEASTGTIGFGPGVVALGTEPTKTGGAILDFYTQLYGPLLRGDFDEFRRVLAENPTAVLDWLGGYGLVAGTVRRAGLATRAAANAPMVGAGRTRAAVHGAVTGKVPQMLPTLTPEGELAFEPRWGKPVKTKTLKVTEGRFGEEVDTGLQAYEPRGPLAQHAWRGYEALARIVNPQRGMRRRKAVRETVEANRSRVFADIEGFRKVSRGIQRSPALSKAFDRMLLYGGSPAKVIGDIETEIARRVEDGLTETPAQIDEIQRLREAAVALENATPAFLQIVEQGKRLSEQTERLLIDAGVLNPVTAERMRLRPVQFLERLPEVSSPRRDEMVAVLREQDWTDDQIADAMAYMDANAVSWARRNDIDDPGLFYEEMYRDVAAVEWEDINDLYLDNSDEILTQRGDEVPFEVSINNAKARVHNRAREELLSDDPEVRAAAEAKAVPKRPENITTVQQKIDRVTDQIPDKVMRAEFARWYHDIWPEFGRHFGDDTEAAVRTFLISQAAMSPADGIATMLKILEVKYETGKWPKAGTLSQNTGKMVHAWENAFLGEDPKGIAAKISDFFGSAYGQETRAWLQHLGQTGPGVVDRWTLRSDGFWDWKTYEYLVSQGIDAPNPNPYLALGKERTRLQKKEAKVGLTPEEQARLAEVETQRAEMFPALKEFYDMSAGPTAYQYEWSSIRLNEMRDRMNEMAYDGRTDWTVDEAQALDWFATRSEWGQPGGGWEDTWARSTFNVVGDVTGEMRKEWLAGAENVIITEVKTSGPTGRTQILGTESQAERLATRMTEATGRPAYVIYDAGAEVSASRKWGARKQAVHISGVSDEVIAALQHRLPPLDNEGLLVLPWGDGDIRIVFADRDLKSVRNARARRDTLVEELREAGVDAQPRASIMGLYHARPRADRRLYRGDDPRGVFARAASARRRGRADFRVRRVADERDARSFVAALARNTRSWSLSDRDAADFIDAGYRGFLTDDGNAGAVISPDGEITNVFNSGSFKGAGGHVLVEALANGGSWLNAFDGFLPGYYSNLGFREVARVKFNEAFMPEGWDYSKGRPDIVFMAYAPHRPVRYAPYVDDYDTGAAAAKRVGDRTHRDKGIDSILEELADRGDGLAHQNLAQWKRSIKVDEGDPIIQGAVRMTDEGVELLITNAANFSTLVHENAHATMRATMEWLRQGEDPRLPVLMDALGIDDVGAPYSIEAQELFARLVETHAYTLRMRAPQMRRFVDSTNQAMRENYRAGIRQIADSPEQGEKIRDMLTNYEVSSVLDDLIDVTYGPTRSPDAVFIPRLPPTAPSRVAGVIRRITGTQTRGSITRPRKTPVAPGVNKGVRFEKGEYRYGPDVISDYATATFRWQLAEELATDIYRSPFAKEITLDANGTPMIFDDHVPFVYRSVPGATRRLDEALGIAEREADIRATRGAVQSEGIVFDMEPQEAADAIRTAAAQVFDEDVLPANLDAYDPYALEDLLSSRAIVQIPKRVAEDYKDAVSGGVLLSQGAKHISRDLGPLGKVALAPFALFNAAARWSMIGKLAYSTQNFVGAGLTATAHNPFWVGEIKKASDHLSSFSPHTLRIVDEMVGAGTFEIAQVLDEATRAGMSRIERISLGERRAYIKATEVMSLPERRVRRALALRELKASGYDTEAQVLGLYEAAKRDPRWRAEFNQLARTSEDAVIRFRGMNETEQWIVRRAFFVYGWLRASLRYTARFPFEHPVLAAVMSRIGQEGWDQLQETLEHEIGFRGGIVRGDVKKRDGERIARMIDFTGVLPFGTSTEILRAAQSIPQGFINADDRSWETISDMFSPGVAFGLATAFGESPDRMTPNALVHQYGKGKGFQGVPFLSWAWRFNDPSTTETKTFGARTRFDVGMSFLLGQMWPRDTKLDAAHEVWLRRQPTAVSAPIRAEQDLDLHMNRYAQATKKTGDVMATEWTTAMQAHAAYDLGSRLKESEWNDLEKDERELKRTTLRAKVLREFYPDTFGDMVANGDVVVGKEDKITGLDPLVVDEQYQAWVTDQWSEARSYIRAILGEEALG